MSTLEIMVHQEWGKLKEAVVGTAVTMRVPAWSDEYEFVTLEIQNFIRENQGRLLKEADPGLYQ